MPTYFYFLLTILKSINLSFGDADRSHELESDNINCPVTTFPRPSFCRKPCSHQEQCRRGNKLCLCDGECGLSCISKCLYVKKFFVTLIPPLNAPQFRVHFKILD